MTNLRNQSAFFMTSVRHLRCNYSTVQPEKLNTVYAPTDRFVEIMSDTLHVRNRPHTNTHTRRITTCTPFRQACVLLWLVTRRFWSRMSFGSGSCKTVQTCSTFLSVPYWLPAAFGSALARALVLPVMNNGCAVAPVRSNFNSR